MPLDGCPRVPLDLMDVSGFNAVPTQRPALQSATLALALAQLGTTAKDQNLVVQAQREYGSSLRAVAHHIAKANFCHVFDIQTVSAIVILKYCEAGDVLSATERDAR